MQLCQPHDMPGIKNSSINVGLDLERGMRKGQLQIEFCGAAPYDSESPRPNTATFCLLRSSPAVEQHSLQINCAFSLCIEQNSVRSALQRLHSGIARHCVACLYMQCT